MIEELTGLLGKDHVLTGKDAGNWGHDWSGVPQGQPLAVLRPGTTEEVSEVLRLANAHLAPVVPVSGNTGLTGGTRAEGALLLSLDRFRRIREIRPDARIAVVEAGVVLAALHDATEDHGLIFPLTFGARGSAMVGGFLSTNAGGSNVLRYGNARNLCLGLEVVLPDGEVMNLMSELHKDNSGFDLRDLMIGAEGTLGIITAAVLKLHPKPAAHATAMVAAPSVSEALLLLNELQQDTGGAVDAFEYMPRSYIEAYLERFPDARPPFEAPHEVNILVEIGALSAGDAQPGPDGAIPVTRRLEEILGEFFEAGKVIDAVVARSEAERREMWARREAAAEVSRLHDPVVDNDIAVPPDRMQALLDRIAERCHSLDPGLRSISVAHLGDGNLHFAGWPETRDPEIHAAIRTAVEAETIALGGSFSAEHGIGLAKKGAMARHKDRTALRTMRKIKRALDPNGILNPGKVLPED